MTAQAPYLCPTCGEPFQVQSAVLARYAGWEPRFCRARPPKKASKARGGSAREEHLSLAVVLERYTQGPAGGVFTDG